MPICQSCGNVLSHYDQKCEYCGTPQEVAPPQGPAPMGPPMGQPYGGAPHPGQPYGGAPHPGQPYVGPPHPGYGPPPPPPYANPYANPYATPYQATGNTFGGSSPLSRTTAIILCAWLGWLGVHRFYAGRIFTGILMFLTGGYFGIGVVIDLILIFCKAFKDDHGRTVDSPINAGLAVVMVAIPLFLLLLIAASA
ncbi:MAG: TM2 domain-containing protein [Deltaproteobacteria bacterium]|nr:TM2 domain-containing protein [Deltaproteobacteria bacterium]